ncbi:MAG: hypothetical protein JSU73_08720 [candidate division WOR-3 bacterium]|nr:MAG: hypothetical protein JSU73_08720 [candidate division WOR-3 bacterium]
MPRRSPILLPAILVVGVVSGQWLESEVALPDSMSGIPSPDDAFYVPSENTIWVYDEGSDCVIEMDAQTGRKTRRFQVDGFGTPCFDPVNNRVYCSAADVSVFAFDAATLERVAAVYVDSGPWVLCHNPIANKVYIGVSRCGCLPSLAILDCESNEIVKWLYAGYASYACCIPSRNKVYVAPFDQGGVLVVDGVTDTIVGHVEFEGDIWGMLYDPGAGKVYCTTEGWSDRVVVIDASGDSVVAEVSVGDDPRVLCVNQRDEKVYVSERNSIAVLCRKGDTLLGRIELDRSQSVMTFSESSNRLFCLATHGTDPKLTVISGARDSIEAEFSTGRDRGELCLDPVQDRVWLVHHGSMGLWGFDAGTLDTVVVTMWFTPYALSLTTDQRKLFCAGREEGSLAVISAATLEPTGTVPVGGRPGWLVGNPISPKVYARNVSYFRDSVVRVVNTEAESLEAVVHVGGQYSSMCCAEVGPGRLYVAVDSLLGYVDGATNRFIAVRTIVRGLDSLLYNPVANRVYCLERDLSQRVFVVDASSGVLVASIPVGRGVGRMYCIPERNYLCVARTTDSLVIVIDGAANSVLDSVRVGRRPTAFAYSRRQDKLYVSNTQDGSVSVIDCGTLTEVCRVDVGFHMIQFMVYDSIADKVYGLARSSGDVVVINSAADTVETVFDLSPHGTDMVWCEPYRRCFVSSSWRSSVYVIKDTAVVGLHSPRAHPVAGNRWPSVLSAPATLGVDRAADLLDICGRKVMDIVPGPNDIRHVAPGVYFVKEEGEPSDGTCEDAEPRGQGSEGPRVRKVVIQR